MSFESYSPYGPSRYIVMLVGGRYSFCVVTVETVPAHRLASFVFNLRPDYSCLGSCSFSCCCLWVSLTLDGFTRSPQELQFARAVVVTGWAERSAKDKLVKTHCLLDGVSPRPLGYAAGSVRVVAFVCFCLDRFAVCNCNGVDW